MKAWTLVLALYVFALVINPVLHCDVDCHFKTPTHCQACLAAPSAEPVAVLPPLIVGSLPLAGRVAVRVDAPQPRAVTIELPGRAPPA